MSSTIFKYLAFIFFTVLVIVYPGIAQEEINKEVKVIKPYEPSVSDAFKINQLPNINDTLRIAPEYEYIINTKQFNTGFAIEPIKHARMVGEPLTKLYHSHIKLGLGSQSTPFAEVDINSLRSKNNSFGVFFKHMSSFGKIKLANEQKVDADYSNNRLVLYGKKIYDYSILSGTIGLNRNKILHYGYDTDIDTVLNKKDIDHTYNLFNVNALYQSTFNDSIHLNKRIELNLDYFRDKSDFEETGIEISANLNKFIETELVGADVQIKHYQRSELSDSIKPTSFRFSPWLGLFGKKWRVLAGLNFFSGDEESSSYFYPRGSLQYDIIKHYFIPYVGVGGKLEINNLKKIANENAYILPGLYVKNTDHKMVIFAGIKGNFSSTAFYNLKATYSIIDNMYFYVNDMVNTDSIGNYFNVVYDNIELTHYFGELSIKASEQMDLHFKANYYKYKMSDELKPWHKPILNFTISGKYNLQNKIIVDADVFAITETYTKSYDPALEYITLNGIVDFNLGIEYRYTKILSGFVKFNNISGTRYSRWNYFPLQRFNMLCGITYAL